MERTATARGQRKATEPLDAALNFARDAHSGQHRKQDGRPFIEHPIAVAELLSDRGFEGSVVAAGYLHDVVEKTETPIEEIEQRFGKQVSTLVDALTEDEGIAKYGDRKRTLRKQVIDAGRDAALVFTADRLANIRDWHALDNDEREAAADRLGTTFDERMTIWNEELADLTSFDSELPFLTEVEIELRRLGEGSTR